MEKEVWHNGCWNKLSGSLAEFKTAYKNFAKIIVCIIIFLSK